MSPDLGDTSYCDKESKLTFAGGRKQQLAKIWKVMGGFRSISERIKGMRR